MSKKTRILLKLTGEILKSPIDGSIDNKQLINIAHQIKELSADFEFSIVVGGGNFFRGNIQGKKLELSSSVGHQIGMLATMMNGLIIQDLFDQHGITSTLFCAVPTSEVGRPISNQAITSALHKEHCLIFTGGTGNPFFTTDTTAVLRGLQINATSVWKGTSIDGVYTADPKKDPQAALLKSVSFEYALMNNLRIMDATAFALARQHQLPIRVFNIFDHNALIQAAQNKDFGSTIE